VVFFGLVLKPFSHYNAETHELKTELQSARLVVEKLKNELNALLLFIVVTYFFIKISSGQ
jgi:hypothetical protein